MKSLAQHPLLVIARHELRTLAREKTFVLLLGIFLAMTFFSVFIGWFTRTTTANIYTATVAYLTHSGVAHIPASPLAGISSLAVFDNMIIYIMLIGALLAIVIGHRSFIRERKSGVLPLVFSRPVDATAYVAAKMAGIGVALALVLICAFVVSAVSALLVPALHLSASEFGGLLGFYLVSFLYLALFASVGFFFAIRTKNESTALFLPIMVWVIAVFILPELTTGQNPVALLNPVTLAHALPDQGAFFAWMHALLSPFSVAQFYTQSALSMLKSGTANLLLPAAALCAYLGVCSAAGAYAVRHYDSTQDTLA